MHAHTAPVPNGREAIRRVSWGAIFDEPPGESPWRWLVVALGPAPVEASWNRAPPDPLNSALSRSTFAQVRPEAARSALPPRTNTSDRSDIMDRRDFIASGMAAFGAGLAGTSAQAQTVLPPYLQPALVKLRAPLPAGEVHVFPDHFQLFWTLPEGQAWRYGIRVGRAGLYEPGDYYVGDKQKWPAWTPTPDMIAREPEKYAQYEDGMPGGPGNPLGARAIYLFQPDRGDTFLRIHGTSETGSIGTASSNGCAGLTNRQIKMLYPKVPMGARVVLYPKMTMT